MCEPWDDLHTIAKAPKDIWVRPEPPAGTSKDPTSLKTAKDFLDEKKAYDGKQQRKAEKATKEAKEIAALEAAAKLANTSKGGAGSSKSKKKRKSKTSVPEDVVPPEASGLLVDVSTKSPPVPAKCRRN
jgi:hypothetical protein